MSDEPEIEFSMTREAYARRWQAPPAAPAPRRPAAPPPAPPDFLERIECLYAQHGPPNVAVHSFDRKFALLPDADQASLLRSATDAEFVVYARFARPVVRQRAQDERRQRQMPGRVGP